MQPSPGRTFNGARILRVHETSCAVLNQLHIFKMSSTDRPLASLTSAVNVSSFFDTNTESAIQPLVYYVLHTFQSQIHLIIISYSPRPCLDPVTTDAPSANSRIAGSVPSIPTEWAKRLPSNTHWAYMRISRSLRPHFPDIRKLDGQRSAGRPACLVR